MSILYRLPRKSFYIFRLAPIISHIIYPIYLIHERLGIPLIGAMSQSGVPVGVSVLLTALIVGAMSWAIFAFYEPAAKCFCMTWVFAEPLKTSSALPSRDLLVGKIQLEFEQNSFIQAPSLGGAEISRISRPCGLISGSNAVARSNVTMA